MAAVEGAEEEDPVAVSPVGAAAAALDVVGVAAVAFDNAAVAVVAVLAVED